MIFLRTDQKGSVLLNVYVQPKASFNQICGIYGEALRVRITAPPVDDKANAMLVRFFAKLFKIPKASVTIAQGKQSRAKKIAIQGVDVAEIKTILQPLLRQSAE
jgi:hypothetical protein